MVQQVEIKIKFIEKPNTLSLTVHQINSPTVTTNKTGSHRFNNRQIPRRKLDKELNFNTTSI